MFLVLYLKNVKITLYPKIQMFSTSTLSSFFLMPQIHHPFLFAFIFTQLLVLCCYRVRFSSTRALNILFNRKDLMKEENTK